MRERLLVCILLLALVGCSPVRAPTPAPLAGRADGGPNLIVALQGQMSVKREGWKDYAPALFGTAVQQGDLLRLEGAAHATIACADLTLATLTAPVTSGVPCPGGRRQLSYAGSLANPTRGSGLSREFPVVVSPRRTRVLSPRPTLRWLPVQGAKGYTVRVRGPGLDWSADAGAATEFAYPASAPALAEGVAYKVTVLAGGRSSDEEQQPDLGFTILPAGEAEAVRQAEAKINALSLPDDGRRFLLANLYAGQGLYAEAGEQLESLAKTGEPAILRSLGFIYVKVGLNRLAEERYLQALDRSQKAGDVEGQALAQSALGLIYEAFGNAAEARKAWQEALRLCQQLGDARMARQAEEWLAGLPR